MEDLRLLVKTIGDSMGGSGSPCAEERWTFRWETLNMGSATLHSEHHEFPSSGRTSNCPPDTRRWQGLGYRWCRPHWTQQLYSRKGTCFWNYFLLFRSLQKSVGYHQYRYWTLLSKEGTLDSDLEVTSMQQLGQETSLRDSRSVLTGPRLKPEVPFYSSSQWIYVS